MHSLFNSFSEYVDPPEAETFFLNFDFYFPGLDMMGELCLGALRLQGMQGFWAADGMCSSGAEDGLLRKTRWGGLKKARKGVERGWGFFFWRQLSRGAFWRDRGEEEGFCLRGFTQFSMPNTWSFFIITVLLCSLWVWVFAWITQHVEHVFHGYLLSLCFSSVGIE